MYQPRVRSINIIPPLASCLHSAMKFEWIGSSEVSGYLLNLAKTTKTLASKSIQINKAESETAKILLKHYLEVIIEVIMSHHFKTFYGLSAANLPWNLPGAEVPNWWDMDPHFRCYLCQPPRHAAAGRPSMAFQPLSARLDMWVWHDVNNNHKDLTWFN